ncbi:MAG: biopolymer transporter ExbD [Planctomycetota bacterium]|nr:biopolymer transporter ExbD [Planctomycetota bacterium]
MHRQRKGRRKEDKAAPDLTPMIDVTFQLLIFFIICTRFKVDERNHQVELPKDEGPGPIGFPKEALTIYCVWNEATQANGYVVALGARGRKPVEGSYARVDELLIYPSDSPAAERAKRERYRQVFERLVEAMQSYIARSGAGIEKVEISFAHDATVGAASGTVPWVFVSTAIDATTRLNQQREETGQPALGITFKFADALGVYGG